MKANPFRSFFVIIFFILICGSLGVVVGQRTSNRDSDIQDNLRQFTEVYSLIEQNYAEPVDPSKVIYNGAIPGMLHVLDPHSNFFDMKTYSSFREEEQGKYQGVGMVISPRNDKIIVVAPFSGSPAYRAGIRPGDVILAVDGKATNNMDSTQVSDMLRGPKGTQVIITIAREDSEHPIEFRVIRDEIPRNSVDLSFAVAPGIGYMHLNGFHETTAREVSDALDRFGDLKGLVLDLRGNPGGLLSQAISVSDKFLKKGAVVVSQRGRAQPTQTYYAKEGNDGKDYPLVVLVDRGSASAAEIVAGAIQDHDRGLVLGETTFGKGLVQSVFNLSDNTGLALTTARYYTPSGRLIQRDYAGVDLYSYYMNRGTPPAGDKKDVKLTDGGRTVYGGGGITPDQKVDAPKLDHFQEAVLSHYVFFNFAKHYLVNKHIARDFSVNDETMQDFRKFLAEQKISYQEADLLKDQDWTKAAIKGELFTSEFGQEAGMKARAQADPLIQKALGLLPEAKQIAENARRVIAQKRAAGAANQ
ncbi:MAG TPA: S41 family peptidase [Verrucomicrobiae bacterium]|jgi:carboxyl-terminal processing protease|nr:S41 family peptidase [Verrucomicrobiae bacterium]